jgi:hypothetical protein
MNEALGIRYRILFDEDKIEEAKQEWLKANRKHFILKEQENR